MSASVIAFLIGVFVFMLGSTVVEFIIKPKSVDLEKRLPNFQDEELYEILNETRYSDTAYGKFHKSFIKPRLLKHPNSQQSLSKLLGIDMEQLDRDILEAGLQDKFTVEEIISLRLLSLTAMLIFVGMGLSLGTMPLIILGVIAYMMGTFIPRYTIDRKIKERREAIERTLPNFLDLLKSVTEAGLVIQEAINKVSSRLKGPLAEEFRSVMIETKATGGQWRKAMENMAFRNDIESLSNVVSDILITYEKGTSIVDTLEKEANAMKELRNMSVQEKAKGLSIKLIIPMALFIFFPILILMASPMAIGFMEVMG